MIIFKVMVIVYCLIGALICIIAWFVLIYLMAKPRADDIDERRRKMEKAKKEIFEDYGI